MSTRHDERLVAGRADFDGGDVDEREGAGQVGHPDLWPAGCPFAGTANAAVSMVRAMLRTVQATRYVAPLREGGSLPGARRGRRRRPLRPQVPRRGPGPEGARGGGRRRRAGARARPAGPRARPRRASTPRWAAPSPTRRSRTSSPPAPGSTSAWTSCPARWPSTPAPGAIDPELAAEVVWLDALVTNVDRTPRNPNLLVWHGRPWLIDHGAALYLQHDADARPARGRGRALPA